MRAAFRAQLDELTNDLARTVRVAAQMMTDASSALHRGDLNLAEGVIASEDRMAARLAQAERRCVVLLALRAPVASDIRVLIAVLHTVGELERMYALARHIAKIVQLKHPRTAIPDGVAPVSARMGVLAARQAHSAASTIETRDPRSAGRLARADHELDALRDHLLDLVSGPDWPYGVEPAVDTALIGRYYERFADHAVAIAGQVCYLVTGEYPDHPAGFAAADPERSAIAPSPSTSKNLIEADGVVLDLARRRADVDGHVVHLPARETALLGVLMSRAGQVVYRAALADAAGQPYQAQDRSLDRLLRRLRRRLQPSPLSPARLHCVGDTGYRFDSGPNDRSGPAPSPKGGW